MLHEVVTLTTYITNLHNGGNIKPKSTLGQPNLKTQQVHFHENDCLPDNSSIETSTQTIVHECLSDGGMDPSDNNNVMSAFKAMAGNPPQESPRKIKPIKDMIFLEGSNLPNTDHLVDRGPFGGLAGPDMGVVQKTDRKINIDDHELTGPDVVTAAALFDTQKGPVIGVFHEYAHLGKGRFIHAAGQKEWFN